MAPEEVHDVWSLAVDRAEDVQSARDQGDALD